MLRRVLRTVAVGYAAIAVFERLAPSPWVKAYQRTTNRFYEPAMGVLPGWAVIETTGRKTGLRRRTPIGAAKRGNVVWAVAGNAGQSLFLRNIEADPHVRVRVRGRWHDGVAQVLPDDNARRRLLGMNPINSVFVLIAGQDPQTIRIDLSGA